MRLLAVLPAACLCLAACSSSSRGSASAPVTCEAAGYLTPGPGGVCPVGTCTQADVGAGSSLSCCGSMCMTCESEGYSSFTEAGTCPPGTCPSGNVTATLSCCGTTVCGGTVDAGADATDSASESAADGAKDEGG